MKKIVVLYNLNRGQYEYETEFDSELTISSICNSLQSDYEVIRIEATKDFSWINKLTDIKNVDLVFNVCEGYYGPARESVYAALLEQFQYNYSGPDSTNLLMCHNKYLIKKLVEKTILAPFGYSITNEKDIEKIEVEKFPVIVKLNSEGSSMGMDDKSIVYNQQDLKKQLYNLYQQYKRNIIIEEFIEGEDISIIYIEGIGVLGPCLVSCDSKFYDYEMKTTKDSEVIISEQKGEYKDLKKIVEKIINKLDIKGYAKLDFRVKDNKYYLIEINSQVSFHPEGEFITCAKKEGYSFEQIIKHIVKNALLSTNKHNSIGIGDLDDEVCNR